MSVYSPRGTSCSFYFSSAFSDYYKEDLKTFSEKMKILKAKVKSNPSHLKNEIKEQRKIVFNKERKLNEIINSNKIVFDKEDLIIAADRKNPHGIIWHGKQQAKALRRPVHKRTQETRGKPWRTAQFMEGCLWLKAFKLYRWIWDPPTRPWDKVCRRP